MAGLEQIISVEVGGGASIDVVVWQDNEGEWRACAPTHYPPLPTVTAATPFKALVKVHVAAMLVMFDRNVEAGEMRAAVDKLAGPVDYRAVQFTRYFNLLQGRPDLGPGWEEEAVTELLALSRSLGREGRRASEADAFFLWLGKKIAGEEIFSGKLVAGAAEDNLRAWHTELAARVTNVSPWAPRLDGRRAKPIEDRSRARIVAALRQGPYLLRRKEAEEIVGTGAKGAVDREATRNKGGDPSTARDNGSDTR